MSFWPRPSLSEKCALIGSSPGPRSSAAALKPCLRLLPQRHSSCPTSYAESASNDFATGNARGSSPIEATSVNPVAPRCLVHAWHIDDLLQHTAVILDSLNRANVVVITRQQHALEGESVVGKLQRQPKDRGRVSLSPEFWNDDVPDMTADALEHVGEHVTYRHTPDDSFTVEGKQECRWDVIQRKVHAPLPLFEYFEIVTESHAFFVIVKEVRHLGCRRMVRPQELVFLLDAWPAKHQHLKCAVQEPPCRSLRKHLADR